MIILPLGISFFTFQQITFLVDVGTRAPTPSEREPFANYALFVMMFPHLIAGPIVRHAEIAPQIARLKHVRFGELQATGIMVFAVGLAKKVLIADPLSPIVARSFSEPTALDVVSAWMGLLAYTFQLYFDFSGYSDMAIGIAAMFGVVFPANFRRPYLSTSIQDFWRRWHITLSMFLRDYLYIPMGGGRGRIVDISLRILATMLLGGLWHGAGWNFVVWGGYHGLLLVASRLWAQVGYPLPTILAWALTTLAVVLGWVWFRSSDLASAVVYFQALSGYGTADGILVPVGSLPPAFWIAPFLVLMWNERLPVSGRFAALGAIASGLLILLCVTSGGEFSEFLYFQF